jgi:predicted transcriptional regulator
LNLKSNVKSLIKARNMGLILHQLIILGLLQSKPHYIGQLATILESNHATVRRMVMRLNNTGWTEQVYDKAPTGYQSRPFSALIKLIDEGLNRLKSLS